MADRLFYNETSVFKNKLNNILTDKPQANLVRDILTLLLLRNSYKDEKILKLVEVYNAVGLDNFMSIIGKISFEAKKLNIFFSLTSVGKLYINIVLSKLSASSICLKPSFIVWSIISFRFELFELFEEDLL